MGALLYIPPIAWRQAVTARQALAYASTLEGLAAKHRTAAASGGEDAQELITIAEIDEQLAAGFRAVALPLRQREMRRCFNKGRAA